MELWIYDFFYCLIFGTAEFGGLLMDLSHAQQQRGKVRLGRQEMVTVCIVPLGAQATHSSVHHKQANRSGIPYFSPAGHP